MSKPVEVGQYVRLGDVDTWVERRGAGQPVLLLHGGFGHTGEWESSLFQLADTFDVIAYDRRGHGRTADVGEWDRPMLIADAVALLDALELDSVHVIGYSDGGVVGAGMAAVHPDRVRSLTLMCTALRREDWIVLPEEPDEPDEPDESDPAAGLPDEIVEGYRTLSPDGDSRLTHVVARAAALSRTDYVGIADYPRRVLVLTADDDLVTLESQLAMMRSVDQGELAVVPHSSHDVPRERPDLVTELVRSFLAPDPAPTHIPIRR